MPSRILDEISTMNQDHYDSILRSMAAGGYIKDPETANKVMAAIDPPVLHLDFETCSQLDLRKAGVSRYARDPSTRPLCVSWAIDDKPAQFHVWTHHFDKLLPAEITQHITNGYQIHAWNAAFEMAILEHQFGIRVDPGQFSCTMQRALVAGYPGKLEDSNPAIGLHTVKDSDGHKLMMKMCKPRDKLLAAVRGFSEPKAWWHLDPNEGGLLLKRLGIYCCRDVDAERAAGKAIPKLTAEEKRVSEMDWRANRRGVRLDLDLVDRFITLAEAETRRLDMRCDSVTLGSVTSPGTQTARLVKWLEEHDCPIPDVSKETVAETLETGVDAGLSPEVMEVLVIRQKVAKSSVKKLKAMLACVDADGRVRFVLQYYGAGRTGRWSGRLIQPQNFPRPAKAIPINKVVDFVKTTLLATGEALDAIRALWGDPLEVIARCLRGTILPAAGKVLVVFDFSQIEARVLAWLAGQQDILDEFASGRDVYVYTQNKIGLPTRDAGKVVVLGLGFGTGWKKFIELAKGYGLILTALESQQIVQGWRDANQFITGFWRELDSAAKQAIRMAMNGSPIGIACRRGIRSITVAVKAIGRTPTLMTIKLPSGRHLYYRNPRLETNTDGYDEIVFDGVDQTTKKWVPIRTWGAKLAENITQAVARDIMAAAAERVGKGFSVGATVTLGTGITPELVLSVHDELIWEADPGIDVDAMKHVIEAVPAWAIDLPIACEGGIMQRYGKK